jgi:hypothetical protein
MADSDSPRGSEASLTESNGTADGDANESWKRRKLMKAGAVASAGVLGAAAGCTSSPDSGGDGGSGDGGSGDGGDGGDGGNGGDSSGSQESRTTVRLLLAPTGFQGIIMDYLANDTEILSDYFSDEDLEVEVSRSWEGAAIFTSGGADFETFGSLEAAKLAGERDIPLAVNANLAPQIMQVVGERGGPYDPANSGSPQASMDRLAEQQDVFALGGWGGGTGIMMPMIVQEAFGYTFTDDESSDFENIRTAEYSAVPPLVENGDVAMGTSSPIHGASPFMAPAEYTGEEPTVTSLYGCGSIVAELEGFNAPQLNSWTCSQEYASQYPGSPRGVVRAFSDGLAWLYEDPIGRIEGDDEHLNQLGLENMDQAQYVLDWGINLSLDNELPVIYEDIELTDQFIEEDKNFLRTAQDVGFLTEGWEENLDYRQVTTE